LVASSFAKKWIAVYCLCMKVEHLKRLPALIVSALLLLASLGTVSANQPYFKTYGGDVMTGGWYKSGNSCPAQSSGYYQDSNYPQGGADIRNGGILTYARVNNNVSYLQTNGASSQYAAFSLGSIDGDATQNDGFNSAGAQAATTPTFPWALAFSNNHSGNTWGGLYEGNVRQSNCIPDYFGTKQNSPQSCCNITAYGDSIDLNNADGQYLMTPSSGSNAVINPAGIAIPAGKHITVFVKGNAYIPSNITYAPHNANNVPKFSLVASGSIYIDPAVTQLDGVYIAEPATNDANTINADDGTIWTCHPNNSLTLDYFYPPTCTNPLLVNGAFISK